MAKIPAIEATVNADTAHRTVTVVVEHEIWQSFSRAVLPRGRKEFKRWVSEHIMFGDLREEAADLGGKYLRGTTTRCLSTVTYTY